LYAYLFNDLLLLGEPKSSVARSASGRTYQYSLYRKVCKKKE